MSAPASFWLYLDSAGPGERARRVAERAGEQAVQKATDHWSGRVIGPGIFRSEIEEALGAPDRREPDELLYYNPSRPDHAYSFLVDPERDHRLIESGYVRLGPPIDPPPEESWEVLVAWFIERGATAQEVRHWIGDPLDVSGWWPVETWQYGDNLMLDLRHGVVEHLVQEAT